MKTAIFIASAIAEKTSLIVADAIEIILNTDCAINDNLHKLS